MSALNDAFDVLVADRDSGAKAVHVRVKHWMRPASAARNDGVFCLTNEATNRDEFESSIDELIAQLERLKAESRRKLAKAFSAG